MKKAIAFIIALILLLPTPTFALSIAPIPPIYIEETAQKAVIFYQEGVETLILSTTFRGNAKDFGWLIPVPSKPEVDKASDELYTALDDLTRPKYSVDRGPLEIPFGISGLQEKSTAPQPPQVIDTKELDIFDISVIEAKDEKGLIDWFAKNNYPYPADRSHIIKDYVSQNWYFVAVKVNSQAQNYAKSVLTDGHATPIKLSFKTDKIIYPFKLSAPGIQSSVQNTKIAAFSFERGIEGFNQTFANQQEEIQSPQGTRVYPRVNLSLDSTNSYHGKFSLKVAPSNPQAAQNIAAQASISNLKPGKTYTLSAWAKSVNPKNGSVYLALSGNTSDQSVKLATSSLSNWQKLQFTFVAPQAFALIQLAGTNFAEAETVNWDAVQLEEGDSVSDFTQEILPKDQPPQPTQTDQVTILLYVFADHKKELPGFTTSYASWVKPEIIEKLAFTPNGEKPWINAKQRMYLTKLHRITKPSEATTDLILRDAQNNNPVNAESFPQVSTFRFFTVIILILLVEIGAIIGFIIYKKRKGNVDTDS